MIIRKINAMSDTTYSNSSLTSLTLNSDLYSEEFITNYMYLHSAGKEYLTTKWKDYIENDPFYNPNFSKKDAFMLDK